MSDLTPRQLVAELDRYIVGQEAAKRAVAIAVRNRWRRQRLGPEMRDECKPKNLLMIGPTGVGKTEIARRLAQLTQAPFIKIEATKFTEVGYHGRDVDSIIRDLLERAIALVREELAVGVQERAAAAALERLLDELLPPATAESSDPEAGDRRRRSRDKLREQLQAGDFSERTIEVSIQDRAAPLYMMGAMGLDQMEPEFERLFERVMPPRNRRQRLPAAQALEVMTQQEIERLIDREALHETAIRRCEEGGIVFLDELDKLCGGASESGPDVSRSGVQRDLLPLVEGTTVSTRHGVVRTDHILFIAAGAFTQSRPADLMPELQGRFPIRVELEELSADDYHRILTEPRNAMLKQQIALLETEGVRVQISDDAVLEMARMAHKANETLENIGARRLHTIVEKVFDDIAFHASDAVNKDVSIDLDYVRIRLADAISDEERSQYEL